MENSTLCVINENCAYKVHPRQNFKFPDSARDYPVFEATTEPTNPSKSGYALNSFLSNNEETNVEEYTRKSQEKFKFLAIIVCCVIWTLAAITITLCMLKMVDIV